MFVILAIMANWDRAIWVLPFVALGIAGWFIWSLVQLGRSDIEGFPLPVHDRNVLLRGFKLWRQWRAITRSDRA